MSKGKEKFGDSTATGVWYGIIAYLAWGILPVYWKVLQRVPAGEILAHRIVWSCIFVFSMLWVLGRLGQVKAALVTRKHRWGVLCSSLLISANWFVYIWAVNSGHIVEASLGYYINPLFTVLLGLLVLRERIDIWQVAALILAAAGVAVLTVEYGKVPWIALTLAISFGLYGLAKKLVNVEAMAGLALETAFVTPVALAYIIFLQASGRGSLGTVSPLTTVMLLMAGVVTALPLLWFGEATKRIPLATVGFIQYLSPSISLLLGVFLYQEPFTRIHLISFSLIWCALALYSLTRVNLIKITRLHNGKAI